MDKWTYDWIMNHEARLRRLEEQTSKQPKESKKEQHTKAFIKQQEKQKVTLSQKKPIESEEQ